MNKKLNSVVDVIVRGGDDNDKSQMWNVSKTKKWNVREKERESECVYVWKENKKKQYQRFGESCFENFGSL
jgi:hypothetical protein